MIAVRSNAVPPQTFPSASACATARQDAVGPARVSRSIRVDVVDRFDRGAVIVETGGRIRFSDCFAQAVLDRGDGLVEFGGLLRATHADETVRLLALVADATATSRGECVAAGGPLRISRRKGAGDYQLIVSPLLFSEPQSDAPEVLRSSSSPILNAALRQSSTSPNYTDRRLQRRG